jgi:RecA-family ATPase
MIIHSDVCGFPVYSYAELEKIVASAPPDLIEGLITDRSVNLLVGDSNLGKTPLAVTLGLAVASGKPFLGRTVRPGPVLYCDAETSLPEFVKMLKANFGDRGSLASVLA